MRRFTDRRLVSLILAATLLACWICVRSSHAGLTDLTNTPLGTSVNGGAVKPNILFILDGSGSMNFQFAPDNVDPVEAGGQKLPVNRSFTCRADSTTNVKAYRLA